MKKVIAFLLAVVALLSLVVVPCFAYAPPTDDEWYFCRPDAEPDNADELTMIQWTGLDFNVPNLGSYVFDAVSDGGMDCFIRVDTQQGSLMLGQTYLRLDLDDSVLIQFVGNNGDIVLALNDNSVVGGYIYNPGSHPTHVGDIVIRSTDTITIWYNAYYTGGSNGYIFEGILDSIGDGAFRSQFAENSYTLGYDQGYSDGHKHGVMQGENAGLAAGYEIGYQEGLNESAQEAYDNGYNAAIKTIDSGTFGEQFLGSTFGAPFNALNEIVLVETDGMRISVLTVFWALCGIMLFVWFLKLFAGG